MPTPDQPSPRRTSPRVRQLLPADVRTLCQASGLTPQECAAWLHITYQTLRDRQSTKGVQGAEAMLLCLVTNAQIRAQWPAILADVEQQLGHPTGLQVPTPRPRQPPGRVPRPLETLTPSGREARRNQAKRRARRREAAAPPLDDPTPRPSHP